MTSLKILSNSSCSTYRRCPRLFYNKHEACRELAFESKATALLYGTAVHTGLESYWDGVELDEALFSVRNSEEFELLSSYDQSTVSNLVVGYYARWSDLDASSYETVDVEREFDIEMCLEDEPSNAFRLCGKFDAIARDEHGRLIVVEHKTAGGNIVYGSPYWQRLRMDRQIALYVYAASQTYGEPVHGVLYDVIGKPKVRAEEATPESKRRYRKDGALYANQRDEGESVGEYSDRVMSYICEKPDDVFRRSLLAVSSLDSAEYIYDAFRISDDIDASRRTGIWPRNSNACYMYGRNCSYFSVCVGESRLEDDRVFTDRDAHPELFEISKKR